jgi:hypothetical protein
MRRSHCVLERPNVGRELGVAGGFSAGASASWNNSGGLNGVIFSGASAGEAGSDADTPAADVKRRVPQLLQDTAVCGFNVPQMGQRISVEGCSSAAQFLQNLLLGLLGVPHCGQ